LQDGARPAAERHVNQNQQGKAPVGGNLSRCDCRSLTWRSRQASRDKTTGFGCTIDYLV
jgi:hypothetical protein